MESVLLTAGVTPYLSTPNVVISMWFPIEFPPSSMLTMVYIADVKSCVASTVIPSTVMLLLL